MRGVRTATLCLVALVLASGWPLAAADGFADGLPHINIYRDGDFTPANGVVGGSGTESDPYRIEGWVLDGPAAGITIRYTKAYAVLSNITVNVIGGGYGLELDRVTHLSVDHVDVTMDPESVWPAATIGFSSNVTVRDSTFVGGDVRIYQSGAVQLDGNVVEGGEFDFSSGISFTGGGPIVFGRENRVNGGPLVAIVDKSGVSFVDQVVGQLVVVNCTDLEMRDITGANGDASFYLTAVANVRVQNLSGRSLAVYGTNVSLGGVAIQASSPYRPGGILLDGVNVTMRSSWIRGEAGAAITGGEGILIDNLTVESNASNTLLVSNAVNVTVRRSSFSTHGSYGVYVVGVSNISIEDSEVVQSGELGLLIIGSVSVRLSNNAVDRTIYGAMLQSNKNVTIEGNSFGDSMEAAVYLSSASGLRMSDNDLGKRGLLMGSAWPYGQASAVIDESNVLDSGPLRFYVDCFGLQLDGIQAGQVILANCTGVEIRNLHMEGAAIPLQGAYLQDVSIDNVVLSGNSTGASFYGVELLNVTGSSIGGSFRCLVVSTAAQVRIEGSSMLGCATGVRLEMVFEAAIRGNMVGPEAVSGIQLANSEYVAVSENRLEGGGLEISGQFRDSFSTIDVGPNNTAAGDPIEFHKNETGAYIPPRKVGQFIAVNCTDLDIVGLTTTGGTPGGLFAYIEGLSMINSSFSNSTSDGLVLTTASDVSLRDVTASDNGVANSLAFVGGRGLVLQNSEASVEGGVFDRNLGDGVVVTEARDVSFVGGSASGNGARGIWANVHSASMTIHGMLLEGNNLAGLGQIFERASLAMDNVTVSGNTDEGFRVTGQGALQVDGSIFSGNTGPGLNISGSSFEIRDNDFRRNGVGLAVDSNGPREESLVIYNRFENNTVGARILANSRVSVHHNSFVDNGIQAQSGNGRITWDMGYPDGGNYWSDYNGTDRCTSPTQDICPIPDGLGDTPYAIADIAWPPAGAPVLDQYPLMAPPKPPAANEPPPDEDAEPAPDLVVFLTTLPGALLFLMAAPAAAAAWVWVRARQRP